MRERPHPNRTPIIETLPDPADPPFIETPVIQTQDLEHVAAPETRVSNKGVKITPTIDTATIDTHAFEDQHEIDSRDEDALRALEQIEKSLRGQMPG
jgi:hypothetical protein